MDRRIFFLSWLGPPSLLMLVCGHRPRQLAANNTVPSSLAGFAIREHFSRADRHANSIDRVLSRPVFTLQRPTTTSLSWIPSQPKTRLRLVSHGPDAALWSHAEQVARNMQTLCEIISFPLDKTTGSSSGEFGPQLGQYVLGWKSRVFKAFGKNGHSLRR